jgi:hypothetical protein
MILAPFHPVERMAAPRTAAPRMAAPQIPVIPHEPNMPVVVTS